MATGTEFRAKDSGASETEAVPRCAARAVLPCRAMTVVPRPCLVALFALFALFAVAANADEPFRCGKWVITSELTVGEIVSRCGAPDARQSRTEDVRIRNRNTGLMMTRGQTTTETLTWNRGARAAAMVVTVVDGAVKSIERGQ